MKKIWDEQNQQSLYAIDEEALRKKVIKKRNKASAIANRSEVFIIGSLLISSSVIMGASIFSAQVQFLPSALCVFMLVMAGLLYAKRHKRLSWQNTFDKSMLGHLEEAIANAEYQLQIAKWSKLMLFVVAGISIVDVFYFAGWWESLLVLAFFITVFFLAKWEYRTFYLSQRNGLVQMRDKLKEFNM